MRHAPRERVSWNMMKVVIRIYFAVTLHVSVWVEIHADTQIVWRSWRHAPRERVSWNLQSLWRRIGGFCHAPRERVSWNSHSIKTILRLWSHAPRERVSWNRCRQCVHQRLTSRSTWACELKCCRSALHPTDIGHAPRERVSWNCKIVIYSDLRKCHVPRERVGQFSFQRRTYWYWIIQVTAWLRSGGIFIPKYYTIFMRFPSNSPIHTPKFVQTNDL